MIKIETCKRQSDPNNECMWCSKQNLEWIDGHPNGWLEGANTPDLKPYKWEEDIEVLKRQNLKKTDEEADVIVEKEIDQKMAKSAEIEDHDPREYRYEDIAWPRCTLVKPVYDEELGKFKNIRYPLLVKKALEGKK